RGAGIWKSTDSGATFNERRAGHFQHDGSNQRLLCVPGNAGNLYFSSGTQNAPPTGQAFYECQDGDSMICTNIVGGSTSPNDGTVKYGKTVTDVNAFGTGKTQSGSGYPCFYFYGSIDQANMGYYRTCDHFKTFTSLFDSNAGPTTRYQLSF